MAANAYVFLNVEPARTKEIVAVLEKIPRALVREILGPYDVVVELEEDTTADITAVVRTNIRIPGVTSTVTCMWMEGPFGNGAGAE